MYKPSDVAYFQFGVQGATGAATDADSTPTAVVRKNGAVDAAVTVTIASTGTTGGYKGSFTVPSGYAAGDTIVVSAQAVVGGVTGPPVVVFRTEIDTTRSSDVYGRIGVAGAGLTALGDTRLVNLDVAVSTRNATTPPTAAANATAVRTELTTEMARIDENVSAPKTLTTGERTAIANEVEAQIIDDTDSEKVLKAITDKIAAANPDLSGLTLSAIAAAVWAAGTRELSGFSFTVNTNANATETAIKARTDLIPDAPAATGDIPAAADNATATAAAILVTPAHKLVTDVDGNAAIDTTGLAADIAAGIDVSALSDDQNTKLDSIYAKVNTLDAATIRIESPVMQNGSLDNIVKGDDYYAADGRALSFTLPGIVASDVTGINFAVKRNTVATSNLFSVATTSVDSADGLVVTVELSHTNTALLTVSQSHPFYLVLTLTDGHIVTKLVGYMNVIAGGG